MPDGDPSMRGVKVLEVIPDSEVDAVLRTLRGLPSRFDRYSYLADLRVKRAGLFFAVLLRHPTELLPVVYTPGVGEACQRWGELPVKPPGVTLAPAPRASLVASLRQLGMTDIQAVVVTDGNRILGLGDLGANGLGIPVGKCLLYAAAGGLHPGRLLPVALDAGCGDAERREAPSYTGRRVERMTGEAYDTFVDDFHAACQEVFDPGVLIHWEDFGTANAARLLAKYRGRGPTFNDDIQSTAAVTLAAVLGAVRQRGVPRLREQVLLFAGAGQASLGAAALFLRALCDQGLSEEAARQRIWVTDSKGPLVATRTDLSEAKAEYAQPAAVAAARGVAPDASLLACVKAIKPTCLVGAAGKGGLFTADVLRALHDGMPRRCGGDGSEGNGAADTCARPIVLALSNPTDNSECTFQEAWDATNGDVVFAAGSPFDPIPTAPGASGTVACAQVNNALIFPGLGAGTVLTGAGAVPDSFFTAAAHALAAEAAAGEHAAGLVLPPISRIRDAGLAVAAGVCVQAVKEGCARRGDAATPAVLRAAEAAAAAGATPEDVRGAAMAVLRRAITVWQFG